MSPAEMHATFSFLHKIQQKRAAGQMVCGSVIGDAM
jgi:hypothetical protein